MKNWLRMLFISLRLPCGIFAELKTYLETLPFWSVKRTIIGHEETQSSQPSTNCTNNSPFES